MALFGKFALRTALLLSFGNHRRIRIHQDLRNTPERSKINLGYPFVAKLRGVHNWRETDVDKVPEELSTYHYPSRKVAQAS